MTISTATPIAANLATAPGASLLPWIRRGLEGLWLLAVFMVPLVFLGQEYSISEAQIAYVEVPKVALLRTLAGLIALLWSLEWAIQSRAFQGSFPPISIGTIADKLQPSKLLLALKNWLNVHPTRWLLLAAGLFFGSTFLSTVLSGSVNTSLWGEIPGQDGYAAYTIASYLALFAVIATHLKNRAQLGRLLGALVLMGSLVGVYGSLQHYGHDFFGITEFTGGGTGRVTIFMGNTIFAAAVLSMTVPVTIVAAAINFHDENWGDSGPLSKLGQLGRDYLFTSLWASILAVQLLGLMFTFSRGPWAGAVVGLVVFLGLVLLSLGWRMVIRTGLVLGLAGVLIIAFLHWQGNVTIVNLGPWLGLVLALLGLAGTFAALFVVQNFGRAIVILGVVGVVAVVVGVSVIAPSALSGRGNADSTTTVAAGSSTGSQITGRITSIKTDVLGGFIGGRGTHWKVSWTLIKDRPWFAFGDLSLSWLRPLIGYGPDLFRYTYLLESTADTLNFLPLEPDHAHNFFIHQTVEQGIFGGITSLALFASVFGVVGHHILRRRHSGNPVYRLVLFGLMAIIFGRFLEMMVGVARISDLTVLWIIFGLFAALVNLDEGHPEAAGSAGAQSPKRTDRRSRRRAARASMAPSLNTGLMVRLAIVAMLVGGIGVVTWQKSINNVRASVAEGRALKHFRSGDLVSTVKELDNAIRLAPGVPSYYSNRALIFTNYQRRPAILTEPDCDQQIETPYLVCLGVKSLESNLESVNQRPYNYRAVLAAGHSAYNLRLSETALEHYSKAVDMVPYAWSMRNDLANTQIEFGLYGEAMEHLERSLEITGDSESSAMALYLKGRVFGALGQLDGALATLKQGVSLVYDSTSNRRKRSAIAQDSLNLIYEINLAQGNSLDIEYFNRLIDRNPDDVVAYYNRGLAQLTMGYYQEAVLDLEKVYSLGLRLVETNANWGYARLKAGDIQGAREELGESVRLDSSSATLNAYYGELQLSERNYAQALRYSDIANSLDPNLGLGYLVRGKAFLLLGLEESSKEVFESSVGRDLPLGQHYVDRGEIRAFFGEFKLAFSDLDEAIRINPNQAHFFNARAKAHAVMGNFKPALEDFNTAIQIDPAVAEYFINRGVINDILGDTANSLADFEIANSLGDIEVPRLGDRNSSYFVVHTTTSSDEASARQFLKLQTVTKALLDIDLYSKIESNDKNYGLAQQILAQANLDLELWEEAVRNLSNIIILSPNTPEAYKNRGDANLKLKRYDKAVSDYLEAMELDNFDSENVLGRGRAYAEIGEYELARSDINVAIQLDPDLSDGYKYRGYLSILAGNSSMALSDLDHAIEISPLNHDAYFKRSAAYSALGQTSLALRDLGQAIKLSPANVDYIYARGLIHYRLAEYDSAIKDFDGAIGLRQVGGYVDPRHVKVLVDRGRALLEIGNPRQAVSDGTLATRLLADLSRLTAWANFKSEINLDLAGAHELLGDAYSELGQQADALEEYASASELR